MPQFIDLSQEIYQGQPVYHTHQKTITWTDTSFEEVQHALNESTGGDPPFTFETMGLLLCDHGPTHVDAPRHYKPEGTPINEMALERFHTPGKAIDVSHRRPGEYITKNDLKSACETVSTQVEAGDTLLIRTGHYARTYPSNDYSANYPGLNEEATKWLIDSQVANFGVDQPSPDTPDDPTYPCHRLCREHDLPHIENLRNLDQVIGEEFTFIGFPLSIRGGTGSPIRPVAMIRD